MKKCKKILIIRLGAIGDVVHTTIIPKAIKKAHPDWIVEYLTQSEIAPILENNPYIDKVHPWCRKDRKSIKYLLKTGCELFKSRYDVVFCLTNAIRNMILSVMACPKRIVFRKTGSGLWVEDFFYSAKSVFPELEKPDTLSLSVNEKFIGEIKSRLDDCAKPHIVIIPGGGTDRNRQGRIWSLENWEKLSAELNQVYGGTIIVCGSKGERKYHEKISGNNIILTSGEYSLAQTSALLSLADLVISGDTGTLHIASAHNVKTLALLGSTSPDKIKPYGTNGYYISADTDCKYCWKKRCKYLHEGEKYTPCMEAITVDMVMKKIKDILN